MRSNSAPTLRGLVRLDVEIILTNGTTAAIAAKNATTRIPIVMMSSGDPVGTGLVASLAKPGGNITGYSIVSTELNAKRLALLHELLPTARRVGVLVNPANTTFEDRAQGKRTGDMDCLVCNRSLLTSLRRVNSRTRLPKRLDKGRRRWILRGIGCLGRMVP